jgi:uncharacterized protein (DUF3084 family)
MDWILSFLRHPITLSVLGGLCVGLLVSLYLLIRTRMFRRELEEELADARYDYRRLEDQLNTQMRVAAKAQEELLRECSQYQASIQRLESMVEQLQQKPGRKEQKQLVLLQRASERLAQRAPGYQLAWEQAIQESEAELKDEEKGIGAVFRKVFSGDAGSKKPPATAGEADRL